MATRWFALLVAAAWSVGIASPQSIPVMLQDYLKLSDAQVKSISELNGALNQYNSGQLQKIFTLQLQISTQMAKAAPDSAVVGDSYAQIEMLRRDSADQLAQTQSKIAAVLATDQVMLVNALLDVERLQPLVSEASCIHMEPAAPGIFSFADFLLGVPGIVTSSPCQPMPIPTALANYLSLTDSQAYAIENAIQGNQDYISRQQLKIQELQNEIKDLTAAQTIDSAKLGEDYVVMWQIRNDEGTQSGELTNTVRSVVTDEQKPKLQALDNAMQLFVHSEHCDLRQYPGSSARLSDHENPHSHIPRGRLLRLNTDPREYTAIVSELCVL